MKGYVKALLIKLISLTFPIISGTTTGGNEDE